MHCVSFSALINKHCAPAHLRPPPRTAPWRPLPSLQTDLTHFNLLAELHCVNEQWAEALGVVEAAHRFQQDHGLEDDELPVDLQVGGRCVGV